MIPPLLLIPNMMTAMPLLEYCLPGGFWLFSKKIPAIPANGQFDPSAGTTQCKIIWSDDHGNTWQAPKPLDSKGLDECTPYGRIISLKDGALLVNMHGPYLSQIPGMKAVRSDFPDYAYMLRSHNQGESWGETIAYSTWT